MKRFFSSVHQKWHDWWQSVHHWWQGTEAKPPTIFHSARLKLTGFYLAVLLAFCLTLTLSFRSLAEHEFNHAGVDERGVVRRMLFNQYSVPPDPPATFNQYQTDQDDAVHRHLTKDVVLINLAVLVLGGWLSYWYAGRTLKPIEEAHETQARFAADASHELRTPLASLRVENEVFLRQKSFTEAEARAVIESNLEEVQRLDSLAGSLLALTQYGSAPLQLTTLEIGNVVDTALQQQQKAAKQNRMSIEQHIQPARIMGNSESLTQLLAIMLDNALKYGPDGSTVHVRGSKHGNNYLLSVRDEGPGIASSDLPHIFERLYRGDKARNSKTGGYGLGLSLAQEIVQANHAGIDAGNFAKGGAIFTVTLNMAKSS